MFWIKTFRSYIDDSIELQVLIYIFRDLHRIKNPLIVDSQLWIDDKKKYVSFIFQHFKKDFQRNSLKI